MKSFFVKIRSFLKNNNLLKGEKRLQTLGVASMGFCILFLLILFLTTLLEKPKHIIIENKQGAHKTSGFGVLGDEVNNKIFIQDVEKDYFELKQKLDDLTGKLNNNITRLADDQKFIGDYLEKLTDRLDSVEKKMEDNGQDSLLNQLNVKNLSQKLNEPQIETMKLEFVDIHPIDQGDSEGKDVHLPMGSYCRGTLLTGVHAPADESNPLPVLIRLEEAFVGPNRSSIPLKGTFILGSAYGEIVSKRAYIEIFGLSTVFPDGSSFERNIPSLGYIGDEKSEFGIQGEVVRSSGRELGISFLAGFMSGASQAFSDSETTSFVSGEGTIAKSVTGNATKNATFQGLASSSANLSEYYQKQVDRIIPSIRVRPGVTVYFYVQKGVTINGLKVDDEHLASFAE